MIAQTLAKQIQEEKSLRSAREGKNMMQFDMPIVSSGISVKNALAEVIDSRRSGVLVRAGQGKLRLVHFNLMAEAAAKNLVLLQEVDGEPVVQLGAIAESERKDFVQSAGGKFGLIGTEGRMAILFSVSEGFAGPYFSISSGVRCDRPGKPPSRPNRKWYHYYPPNDLPHLNPTLCKFCPGKLLLPQG
jgi:hypothetical protein